MQVIEQQQFGLPPRQPTQKGGHRLERPAALHLRRGSPVIDRSQDGTDLGNEVTGDIFASAEYRTAVAPVYVKRAIAAAAARAGLA